VKICYNHDLLEEVIDSDYGITEHEEALRDLEHILQVTLCLGFEVFDAIVPNIPNGTTSERWKAERWDLSDAVVGELGIETRERVCFKAMLGSRDECLSRIGTNEAVSTYGLGSGSRLEQEGQVGIGAAASKINASPACTSAG
jgi:hypothetical protein